MRQTKIIPNDDWITTREAVKLSGFHPDHLRTLIRQRRIKARKFFVVWLVSRSSVKTYLAEQEQRGARRGRKPLTKR